MLLVKRGEEPNKGRGSVPRGRVNPGETPPEAAVREASEQTGLQVQILRELWVASVPTGEGRRFEIHDFRAIATDGTLTPGDDAEDARWVARTSSIACRWLQGLRTTRSTPG